MTTDLPMQDDTDLTDEQYHVCRLKGTEPPFSGKYLHNKKTGMYVCVCCGNQLFDSAAKFDSGSGWPSFDRIAKEGNVRLEEDFSYGMHRVEVLCDSCDAHLGHLFPDGPTQTGERYCINSVALNFEPEEPESTDEGL